MSRLFFQKIIQEMQTAYLMHGQFTPLDVDNIQKDTRYVYFVRLTEEAIPNFETYEEAQAQMPDYLLVGSCSSYMLSTMIEVTKEVKGKGTTRRVFVVNAIYSF